jgi:hypothetical protein
MHDDKPRTMRLSDLALSGLVRFDGVPRSAHMTFRAHESRLYEQTRFHPAVIGAAASWTPNVGQEGRS